MAWVRRLALRREETESFRERDDLRVAGDGAGDMRGRRLVLMGLLLGVGAAWAHEGRIMDLKTAPLDQQVDGVGYCKGRYRVTLRDGTAQVFKEFDLRFETDSGPNGPRLGSPVLIPAGGRGDRAFLIFSRPDEMKVFLKETC